MTGPSDSSAPLSSSLEDYLETIYELGRSRRFARVRDIARAREVKAGSVSPALKRLAELGLVDYVRREYVGLTPAGEEQARRVLARHQLLTRFFQEVLGMSSEAAQEQACVLEHALSNETMDRMAGLFEFLGLCPELPAGLLDLFRDCALVHGDAARCRHACGVHAAGATQPRPRRHTVAELAIGEKAVISQVDAQGAIRQRLLDMGLLPGAELEVERVAPSGDPIWIKLQGYQLALRRKEAQTLRVK